MHLFNDTVLSPGPHSVGRSVWTLIAEHAQQIRKSWAVRRERLRELDELYYSSDRELLDLGIGRSDFPAIRNGTYRRDF